MSDKDRSHRIADKVRRLAGTEPPVSGVAASPASQLPEPRRKARSLLIAQSGLRTGFDTINMLTATITDVLEENVTTNQANVVVNAIGKVLKVVELQQKYGRPRPEDARERDLVLIGTASSISAGASPEH